METMCLGCVSLKVLVINLKSPILYQCCIMRKKLKIALLGKFLKRMRPHFNVLLSLCVFWWPCLSVVWIWIFACLKANFRIYQFSSLCLSWTNIFVLCATAQKSSHRETMMVTLQQSLTDFFKENIRLKAMGEDNWHQLLASTHICANIHIHASIPIQLHAYRQQKLKLKPCWFVYQKQTI